MSVAISAVMALIVASAQTGTSDPVILPGVVDLPYVPGAEPCISSPDWLADQKFGCAQVPFIALNGATEFYTGMLMQRGWRFAGGASVEFNLQRDLPDGGCEGIDVGALTDFAVTERADVTAEELAMLPAFVVFEHRPTVTCYRPEE